MPVAPPGIGMMQHASGIQRLSTLDPVKLKKFKSVFSY